MSVGLPNSSFWAFFNSFLLLVSSFFSCWYFLQARSPNRISPFIPEAYGESFLPFLQETGKFVLFRVPKRYILLIQEYLLDFLDSTAGLRTHFLIAQYDFTILPIIHEVLHFLPIFFFSPGSIRTFRQLITCNHVTIRFI